MVAPVGASVFLPVDKLILKVIKILNYSLFTLKAAINTIITSLIGYLSLIDY